MKEFVELGKTAVVIVDMQNDYCSEKGYFAQNLGLNVDPIQTAAAKIKKFVEAARNKGLPIIFTKMTEDKEHVAQNLKRKMELTHGDFFAKPGSWGHDLYEIVPENTDLVLEKNHFDAFTNPDLEKILKEKGIENLIVCGFTTIVCVDTTVRSAFSKGFNIVLPKDLVATVGEREKQHNATLSVLGFHFAYASTSEDIENILEGE